MSEEFNTSQENAIAGELAREGYYRLEGIEAPLGTIPESNFYISQATLPNGQKFDVVTMTQLSEYDLQGIVDVALDTYARLGHLTELEVKKRQEQKFNTDAITEGSLSDWQEFIPCTAYDFRSCTGCTEKGHSFTK